MSVVAREAPPITKSRLWTGWVLTTIAILFLLFDGIAKVMKDVHVLAASARLAYPESAIVLIGTLLLVFTVLYAVPRTSVLGAVLLTGYLGGAVASQVRIGAPVFDTVFPIIFAGIVWGGIFLREPRLSVLLPVRR